MERHVQAFLNKLSFASITIATLTLLVLFLHIPQTCVTDAPPPSRRSPANHKSTRLLRFPKSSCDISHREILSMEKRNNRLWSTKAWIQTVASYTDLFRSLQSINLLFNHSNVLCISAGAGHSVMAISSLGVSDITGVEVLDSPPLVNRADPHNLPFFDGVFDFAFSANFPEALFPSRFVSEMERTVRGGGVCVLAIEGCKDDDDVKEIARLFRQSEFVSADNVTLIGLKMRLIILRVRIPS